MNMNIVASWVEYLDRIRPAVWYSIIFSVTKKLLLTFSHHIILLISISGYCIFMEVAFPLPFLR